MIQSLNKKTYYTSFTEEYLIQYIDDLSVVLPYDIIKLEHNLNLQRLSYIAQVKNSKLINFSILFTNTHSEPLIEVSSWDDETCCLSKSVPAKTYKIGVLAVSKKAEIIQNLGVSLDSVLHLVSNPDIRFSLYISSYDDFDDQYNDILNQNVSIAILYFDQSSLAELLNNKDISTMPYIFAVGYDSGQYCNPKVYHVTVTSLSIISIFFRLFLEKNFVIICSDSYYGKSTCEYIKHVYNNLCIKTIIQTNNINYDIELNSYKQDLISHKMYLITVLADDNKLKIMKFCEDNLLDENTVFMVNLNNLDYINAKQNNIRVFLLYLVE